MPNTHTDGAVLLTLLSAEARPHPSDATREAPRVVDPAREVGGLASSHLRPVATGRLEVRPPKTTSQRGWVPG
jgi:hypothetical protein